MIKILWNIIGYVLFFVFISFPCLYYGTPIKNNTPKKKPNNTKKKRVHITMCLEFDESWQKSWVYALCLCSSCDICMRIVLSGYCWDWYMFEFLHPSFQKKRLYHLLLNNIWDIMIILFKIWNMDQRWFLFLFVFVFFFWLCMGSTTTSGSCRHRGLEDVYLVAFS